MAPIAYQAGNRIHAPDGVYTLPSEEEAGRLLQGFVEATQSLDDVSRSFRTYDAHLEALLAGADFVSERDFEIDPAIFEVPKPPARK